MKFFNVQIFNDVLFLDTFNIVILKYHKVVFAQ